MHKPKIEFPPIVEGPSAWVHSDVSQGKNWQIHLSEEQVLEIENAASQIKASGLELATMTKDDFFSHICQNSLWDGPTNYYMELALFVFVGFVCILKKFGTQRRYSLVLAGT